MTQRVVSLLLNQQQLQMLDNIIAQGAAPDRIALVRRALKERELPKAARPATAAPDLSGLDDRRELLSELVIQPGTGKALEVLQGQLLRVEQVEGGQCADFNCFNLHDYKEFMHCGRTRTVHGLLPTTGDFLWSAPPTRAGDDVHRGGHGQDQRRACSRACSAYLYESAYGMPVHTNCHDIQSEAQREYGLTPDDVHDSFNLFMATEVQGQRALVKRQTTQAGDHVDMLALMDVLAVATSCGGRHHAHQQLLAEAFETADLQSQCTRPGQRATADDVHEPAHAQGLQDREHQDRARTAARPAYQPQFTNVPLRISTLDVGRWKKPRSRHCRPPACRCTTVTMKALRCAMCCSAGGNALHGVVGLPTD